MTITRHDTSAVDNLMNVVNDDLAIDANSAAAEEQRKSDAQHAAEKAHQTEVDAAADVTRSEADEVRSRGAGALTIARAKAWALGACALAIVAVGGAIAYYIVKEPKIEKVIERVEVPTVEKVVEVVEVPKIVEVPKVEIVEVPRYRDAPVVPQFPQVKPQVSDRSGAKVVTNYTIFRYVEVRTSAKDYSVHAGHDYSSSEQSDHDRAFCYVIVPYGGNSLRVELSHKEGGSKTPMVKYPYADADAAGLSTASYRKLQNSCPYLT